ncbi:hypothetical protein [Paenibacillus sp. W2I17]|uniref:hypothetical protein n=1 Tax=Paenibacillus sp. W2I17 TaxID=3042311 RepID=UPI0027D7E366|nr:hypothetical protein [Paenibacillus sp. W2I17]
MPNWLWLQFALLLVWLIIASFSYYGGLWTASGPVGRRKILQFLMLKFIPLAWLTSSLMIGLYFVVKNYQFTKLSFFMTIALPVVSLFIIICSLAYENSKLKREQQENEKKMESKKDECEKWIRSISFINSQDVTLKLFLSNDKATGRIIVTNVTEEQSELIKNRYMDSLPKGIYLEVISCDGIVH